MKETEKGRVKCFQYLNKVQYLSITDVCRIITVTVFFSVLRTILVFFSPIRIHKYAYIDSDAHYPNITMVS